MKQRKSNAFTLIELIAILVIMAIIALIVTPLVMNIIRKARISADRRSVDAYGRSIELAIAGYLLDTGKFPTSIEQLTIEYSGNKVECETTQINTDSSVYLAGCTVAGRSVEGYTYGSDKSPSYTSYTVGDQITYNNVDYYVIKDSGVKESTVTMLKAEPLSFSEVTMYADETCTHISNKDGYGGIYYHESSSDYLTSYLKTVVDKWADDKVLNGLKESRLITIDEISNLGYEWKQTCDTCGWGWTKNDDVPSWVYSDNYAYWTMTPYNDSASSVFLMLSGGSIIEAHVQSFSDTTVRPVIVLDKSVL